MCTLETVKCLKELQNDMQRLRRYILENEFLEGVQLGNEMGAMAVGVGRLCDDV